jgi:hypothetical protein
MLKKIICVLLVCSFCVAIFASCGGPSADEVFADITFEDAVVHYNGEAHELAISGTLPEGATVSYENNTATEEGEYQAKAVLKMGELTKELSAKLTVKEPTPEQVVQARANTVNENLQSFDYQYKLSGQLSLLGIDGVVEGVYLGQYRENKETGDIRFKRTTSGELLIDSEKYVYSKGNQLITLKMDEDGSIKKIYIETVDEQNETFVHQPIEALVNSIKKENIEKITISSDVPGYKYKAELKLTSDNPYVQKLLGAVSGLGSTISLKGVEIPNLANGIQLYFNYGKGGRIEEFFVSINATIPIKAAQAGVTFSYEQHGASEVLQIPTDSSFIIEDADISTTVQEFNSAMNLLKESDTYSIDVSAINNFDPSWKIAAIEDAYKARLYKNTQDEEVYFNHSYEFKAHHETDGAETYKYTLGNVIGDDAGVYLVSRKGTNVVSAVEGECSADTQFDFLASMAIIDSTMVDCIKVIETNEEITYKIYLNKASVLSIQQKILELINSNDADGVVDVNNYLNSEEYIFEEAVVEVKLKNDELVSIKCETEIRYTPTGGEYTEYNVALKNTIDIAVNNKLEDAQEYEAPSSTGNVLGIGAAKYYIL